MQHKKTNKILIIAVALIWGVVLYKFSVPYLMTTDTVVIADVLVKPPQAILRKRDTFNLMIPLRDPFLGSTTSAKKSVVISSKPTKTTRSKPVASKNWPKIAYLGFVKSQTSASKLGLLRVDGVLKRVRKGATVGSIRIKDISDDHIAIQMGKDVKDFRKKN